MIAMVMVELDTLLSLVDPIMRHQHWVHFTITTWMKYNLGI